MSAIRGTTPSIWQRTRETRVAYAFLLPVLALFVIFRIGPALASFVLSFLRYRISGNSRFLGLGNYRRLLDDHIFWQSLKVTAIYTAIAVPLVLVLALAMALLVNRALRGMSFFRALYFLPYITSMVMVGVIWKWMYKADDGLLNSFLAIFRVPRIPWIEDDRLVLVSLALMSTWKGVGYAMMILLARLRGIPVAYQEAASIDGATAWQRFTKITLPLLKPVIFFVLVIETIGSFQVFDAIYVMTGGGPVRASYSLVYMLYDQGFRNSDFGYAGAIGVVLFVIVLCLAIGQRAILGRSDT